VLASCAAVARAATPKGTCAAGADGKDCKGDAGSHFISEAYGEVSIVCSFLRLRLLCW
jgi:hypothetical protein